MIKVLYKVIPLGIRKKIKSYLNTILNSKFFRLLRAYKIKSELMVVFLRSKNVAGKNSKKIHAQVIELFGLTSGTGLDEISNKLANDSISVKDNSKYFSKYQSQTLEIVSEIKEKGFFVIESVIPKNICDEVVSYALSVDSFPRPEHGKEPQNKCLPIKPYKSARYDFSPNPMLIFGNEIIQELIFDPFIFDISQKYLGGRPYLDPVEMWWYFPFESRDQNWAEDYHFDLDSLKWLKFFINFEEVKIENGPHCFIEGTHSPNTLPDSILSKGYARIRDDEVFDELKNSKVHIFTAPAGSLLIEDTKGLHKGLTPQSGRRLLFQMQYSNVYIGHHSRLKIDNLSNISEVMKLRVRGSKDTYSGHFSNGLLKGLGYLEG